MFASLLLLGCKPAPTAKPIPKFKPLQNGFGVVAQWIGVDTGPGAKLYYKGTNQTPILVWPYIGTHGDPILFTNDIALLLADKPDAQGYFDSAFILVQGSGPVMDISDDILKHGTLATDSPPLSLARKHIPFSITQVDDRLSVKYMPRFDVGEGIPQSLKVSITWKQIFSIMEDVRRTGRTNKVTNTEVLYLQKD